MERYIVGEVTDTSLTLLLLMSGLMALAANAIPEASPPPAIGVKMASR